MNHNEQFYLAAKSGDEAKIKSLADTGSINERQLIKYKDFLFEFSAIHRLIIDNPNNTHGVDLLLKHGANARDMAFAYAATNQIARCNGLLAINQSYKESIIQGLAFAGDSKLLMMYLQTPEDYDDAVYYSVLGRNRELTDHLLTIINSKNFIAFPSAARAAAYLNDKDLIKLYCEQYLASQDPETALCKKRLLKFIIAGYAEGGHIESYKKLLAKNPQCRKGLEVIAAKFAASGKREYFIKYLLSQNSNLSKHVISGYLTVHAFDDVVKHTKEYNLDPITIILTMLESNIKNIEIYKKIFKMVVADSQEEGLARILTESTKTEQAQKVVSYLQKPLLTRLWASLTPQNVFNAACDMVRDIHNSRDMQADKPFSEFKLKAK